MWKVWHWFLLSPCSHPSAFPQFPSFFLLLWFLGSHLCRPSAQVLSSNRTLCFLWDVPTTLLIYSLHTLICISFSVPFSKYCSAFLSVQKTHLKAFILCVPLLVFLPQYSSHCCAYVLLYAPQTTLWLFLFFLFFQDPHCHFYHSFSSC